MNIFLDANQMAINVAPIDYLTFVGIGTILTGLAAVVGLIITLRQDRETKILSFIKETDREISEQLDKEEFQKDFSQCITYTYNYLDIMERIAFFCKDNRNLKKYGPYYQTFFNYAVPMMAWYISVYDDKHALKESWPKLVEWFSDHVMNPYDAKHLPAQLLVELKNKKINPNDLFVELKEKIPQMKTTWDIINEKRFEVEPDKG